MSNNLKNKKVYFFLGTNAELIRVSPVIKELRKVGVEPKLIFSGQTKIKVEQINEFVGKIEPFMVFPEKVNKSSSVFFFFWALRTFISALIKLNEEFRYLNKQNSLFIIFGDPVSTTIGALVAKIYGLKIVHLESGDMTFNLLEPFPEEICRHLNVRLADVLFPPSKWAYDNLSYLHKPKYNTFYNTTADTLWWFLNKKRAKDTTDKLLDDLKKSKYYILILHRQEHILFRRSWSKKALQEIIRKSDKNLTCVMFNHPLTISLIEELGYNTNDPNGKIKIIPMLSYAQFLHLVDDSEYIVTDGCSNQFEAYMLGTPCLLLRDYTEQVEGLNQNVILYKSKVDTMHKFLTNYHDYKFKPVYPTKSPAEIIVKALEKI